MIYLDEERGVWMFDQATNAEKEHLMKLGERYFANTIAAGLVSRLVQQHAEEAEGSEDKPSATILDFPTVGNA